MKSQSPPPQVTCLIIWASVFGVLVILFCIFVVPDLLDAIF